MKRILVIDDEPSIRNVVKMMLQREGHEVVTACDGIDGVSELRCFLPDIVITDISMPGMDGIELLKVIQKENIDLSVVVMSGNTSGKQFLKTASQLGAVATLEKPFSRTDLIQIIRTIKIPSKAKDRILE